MTNMSPESNYCSWTIFIATDLFAKYSFCIIIQCNVYTTLKNWIFCRPKILSGTLYFSSLKQFNINVYKDYFRKMTVKLTELQSTHRLLSKYINITNLFIRRIWIFISSIWNKTMYLTPLGAEHSNHLIMKPT